MRDDATTRVLASGASTSGKSTPVLASGASTSGKWLSYVPKAGWGNQLFALANALFLATQLDRGIVRDAGAPNPRSARLPSPRHPVRP